MRRAVIAAAAVLIAASSAAFAQDANDAYTERGPRFLAAISPKPVRVDLQRTPKLRQRISVDLRGLPLAEALRVVSRQSGVHLAFSDAVLPERRVDFRADSITVAAALTELLLDAQVDVLFSRDGRGVLVRRQSGVALAGAIVGLVTDAETGLAVEKAEVVLARTRWRAVTDTGGRYQLADVDTGTYTLTVRRLGYTKQSQAVTVREGQPDTVDIVLETAAVRLDEVVTTASGQKRRSELGNDVTIINADSVAKTQPIRSVTDLLEGRVPGLTVQHTSGAPGDPSRLRLRGAGSPLKNNDPMVIVDGRRIYAEQSAARNMNLGQGGDSTQRSDAVNPAGNNNFTSRAYATPSPIDRIDPNTIETIEVFKGPSAAVLYGEDAANGVIVITTKRGKAGPTLWDFQAKYSKDVIPGQYPELYARWGHELISGWNGFCPVSDLSHFTSYWQPSPCVQDSIVAYQMLNSPSNSPLAASHTGHGTLTASGGSASLDYSITGSYDNAIGLIQLPQFEAERYQNTLGSAPPDWMLRPQNLKSYHGSSAIGARLGSNSRVSLFMNLDRYTQQRSSLEQQLGQMIKTYVDETSGKYYYDGYSGDPSVGGAPFSNGQLLTQYFERAISRGTRFGNGVNLDWHPGRFVVGTDAGVDIDSRDDEIYSPYGLTPLGGGIQGADTAGHVFVGHGTTVSTTLNLRVNMREFVINSRFPLLRNARFGLNTGFRYYGRSVRDQDYKSYNLTKGTTLIGGAVSEAGRNVEDAANFNVYLEPALTLFGIRLATALQLQQVGSTYGSQARQFFQNLKNQFTQFPPSFQTSYLLSDKPFFPFKDLFQTFRIRGSFGRASRQVGPTDRFRLYGLPTSQWVGGGFQSTVVLNQIGNADLRPERESEIEGGFDADLLSNSITVTVSGFRKTTTDMVMAVPYAPSVDGGGQINRNIGKWQNTGLEMTMDAHFMDNGPVGITAGVIFSQTHDKLVELAPKVEPFYTTVYSYRAGGGIVSSGSRVAAGYPLFGRWALPVVGYADANGNGRLEPAEVLYGDTTVYTGRAAPNYTLTLRGGLTFFKRAVKVDAGFLYEDGLSQQYTLTGQLAGFSAAQNLPGTSLAEQLRYAAAGSDYASIQTVSAFRFNSLSISYTAPTALAQRLGARSLSVFLMGKNLGLWSNYQGLDPNVNAYSVGNSGVLDTGVLPQPRYWSLQFSAGF